MRSVDPESATGAATGTGAVTRAATGGGSGCPHSEQKRGLRWLTGFPHSEQKRGVIELQCGQGIAVHLSLLAFFANVTSVDASALGSNTWLSLGGFARLARTAYLSILHGLKIFRVD